MARYNAGLNILRTLSNGRYILQLAATVFAARAWFAGLVRLAQQLDQIRSQATTWIRINIRVDGFMAHKRLGMENGVTMVYKAQDPGRAMLDGDLAGGLIDLRDLAVDQ